MPHTVTTTPADSQFSVEKNQTILNAATSAGVNLPYGCGNGFCGACKARQVSGESHYEEGFTPEPLSKEEIAEGMVLCCKAMPQSDITLEVTELTIDAINAETFTTKVTEISRLTDDVIKLVISMGDGSHMQYFAGQYVEFVLDNNKTRAFSVANRPNNQNNLEFHIKHNIEGTFTPALFADRIKEKGLITINGPLGSFFIREESDKPIIMVAGGTGFAPIKAMIEHLIAEKTSRTIKLYWGVQTETDLYMDEIAKTWAQENNNISYIPVLSDADDNWQGETGWVTDVVAAQNPGIAEYDVYLTGPPPMISAGEKSFKALGLPGERMYSDSFETGE